MTISTERMKEIKKIKDKDIDYSDIPETDDSFWTSSELNMPVSKDRITIRIDYDVLKWLKSGGKGYQSRINAILRQYMDAHN